jgi:predicted SAM-dependent methyltransferase
MLILDITSNHLSSIYQEFEIAFFHKLIYLQCLILQKRPTKLHLGSNTNKIKGFANIDYCDGAEYRLDLRRNLPFKRNSVSYIFSEHVLEHFAYPEEISHVFAECFRVLKKGGKMDFSIPDFEKVIKSYYSNQRIFNVYMHDFITRGVGEKWQTKNDFLDLLVRQEGEHKYLYDFSTLKKLLHKIGFTKIKKREKNDYDSQERKDFSLYISCERE